MNTDIQALDIAGAINASKQIKATYTALKNKGEVLRVEARKTTERMQEIRRAPLSRDEVKQAMLAEIDRLASAFPYAAKLPLVYTAFAEPKNGKGSKHKALCLEDLDDAKNVGGGLTQIAGLDMLQNFFAGGLQIESADGSRRSDDLPVMDARRVYFFFGDIIKAKIDKHFNSLFPAPTHSTKTAVDLSIAQKRVELSTLAAKSEEIATQLAVVDEQLKAIEENGAVVCSPFGVRI